MKKRLLSLVLTGTMLLALAACGAPAGETTSTPTGTPSAPATTTPSQSAAPAPSYDVVKLNVAYMPNMGSGSTLITAQKMGYFKDYGLDITMTQFQGGPAEIAAMASGDIQISQIGHGAHALCIEGQAKVFGIDCLGVSDVVMVNAEKGITSIEDLKGKTVASTAGTSAELILELALQKAGMSQDDLNIVEMDAQGMVTAMVSGSIDACATWAPSSTTIEKQMGDKVKTVATNYDFLDVATFPGSFITTDKFYTENHDVLVRFGAALLKAQAYRADHIEEVCDWLATEVEADKEVMLATKDSGEWLTPDVISAGLADGSIENYYKTQQQVFIGSGRIPGEVDTKDYVLYDIMNEAVALYDSTK